VAGLVWYPCSRLKPTHIETRTHDQCGDTIEKSQDPDDGCINVRNMLNTEEVKYNLITSDIKLVSYSSAITMMHGPIHIRFCVKLKNYIHFISAAVSTSIRTFLA